MLRKPAFATTAVRVAVKQFRQEMARVAKTILSKSGLIPVSGIVAATLIIHLLFDTLLFDASRADSHSVACLIFILVAVATFLWGIYGGGLTVIGLWMLPALGGALGAASYDGYQREIMGVEMASVLLAFMGLLAGGASRYIHANAQRQERDALIDPETGWGNTRAFFRFFRSIKSDKAILLIEAKNRTDIYSLFGISQELPVFRAALTVLATQFPDSRLFVSSGDRVVICDVNWPLDRIAELAKEIISVFEKPIVVDGVGVYIDLQIGIATFKKGAPDTPSQAIKKASRAMKIAELRDLPYEQHSGAHEDNPAFQVELLSDFKTAIDDHQLFVVYQPVIDFFTGSVSGVEALVRWKHPQKGMLSPDSFLPAVEKTNLISPLNRFVMLTALDSIQEWSQQGLDMSVAVNLAPRSLQDLSLVDELSEMIYDKGADPQRLVIEVVEKSFAYDRRTVSKVLTALRKMGVRIFIDDFGAEYSALSYLRDLPIDCIKIDGSFVKGIERGGNRSRIVSGMHELAKELNMKCIVEGIENKNQYNALRKIGCRYGQGFYFCKPMPFGALGLLGGAHGAYLQNQVSLHS